MSSRSPRPPRKAVRTVQRVVCRACGWNGGRSDGPKVLERPCFVCGGPVDRMGPAFSETRVGAGCPCGWSGRVAEARIGQPCSKCGSPIQTARTLLEDGTVLG